jgi:transcriptional regulator with XRE-family HTH domain
MPKKKIPPDPSLAKNIQALMELSTDVRTQGALAAKSGVAQSTIGRIVRGTVKTNAGNLRKLAEALGVSVDRLTMDHDSFRPYRDALQRNKEHRFRNDAAPAIPISGDMYLKAESIDVRPPLTGGNVAGLTVANGYALRSMTADVPGLYVGCFLILEREDMPAAWDLCIVQLMDGTRQLLRYVDSDAQQHLFRDAYANRELSISRPEVFGIHGVVAIASMRQWRP